MPLIDVTVPVLLSGIHYMTSPYGMRTLNGVTKMHNGVDLVSHNGKTTTTDYIIAYAAGSVSAVGYNSAMGYYVRINHGDYETHYQHLAAPADFNVGDIIEKGQTLAYMGATGNAIGAHIHFGVLVAGEWTDPMPFLQRTVEYADVFEWAKDNAAKYTLEEMLEILREATEK